MVEIRPVYNPMNLTTVHNTRKIVMTQDDGYEINVLVGVGNRMPNGEGIRSFSGGTEHLYQAHIAVIMDYLGNMRIVKNRYGCDGGNLSNLEVRQELWASFERMGLSYYDCASMMGNFNVAVSQILDEPVIIDSVYPLGINYRDYMRRGVLIKNYKIKKHSLV